MTQKEVNNFVKIVQNSLPYEHNLKLIEKVVLRTITLMEKKPWYKRLFNL